MSKLLLQVLYRSSIIYISLLATSVVPRRSGEGRRKTPGYEAILATCRAWATCRREHQPAEIALEKYGNISARSTRGGSIVAIRGTLDKGSPAVLLFSEETLDVEVAPSITCRELYDGFNSALLTLAMHMHK